MEHVFETAEGWISDMQKINKIIGGSCFVMLCFWTPVFFFVFSIQTFADTHYVSTTGTNSGTCTQAAPCATVSYTMLQVASRDTIKIEPGNYYVSNENEKKIVTAEYKTGLTITAADPSNRPVFYCEPTSTYCFKIHSTSENTTISYLIIDGGGRSSELVAPEMHVAAPGVTIDNCEMRNGFYGIVLMEGKNVTISNCLIHDHGTIGLAMGGGHNIVQWGTTAANWAEKTYIYNTETYNAGEDGYQCKRNADDPISYVEFDHVNFHHQDEDSFDFKFCDHIKIHDSELHGNAGYGITTHWDTPSSNIEIYRNSIHDNGGMGMWIMKYCESWKVYNNLIYNNATRIDPSGPFLGVRIEGMLVELYNNIIYNNGTLQPTQNKGHGGYMGIATVKNNVIYNNLGTQGNISPSSGGTIDYNYVYPVDQITGTNALTVPDPKFVDAANGDFTLQGDSPLIDAGTNTGIYTDFIGNSRPQRNGYDIGAFEYIDSYQTDTVSPSPPFMGRVEQSN